MGGKLSEGINFKDDLGRALLLVGLPYANLQDAELQHTLQHLARATPASSPSLSREAWGLYTDMCMRTVNQTIGRVIRHAADYAVVLLLDERFGGHANGVTKKIPEWMQPSLQHTQHFGECFRSIREFFAEKKQQQQQKQLQP
ncbi:hypothetical protein STCU_10122 [Strigomonas culicis]|uniref:ATP-dependent helicase C-terminal domain-containing protein n=1 Tax=Strigomonas culicis TaxID=28005 RepID=S9TN99_9TRYP|nr:hypothetical protein STCU_10122 [Strigomonas culicis]|eukprot:EPY18204.1 hypothetical protein STCU_10122 [Strigomonas culicis]